MTIRNLLTISILMSNFVVVVSAQVGASRSWVLRFQHDYASAAENKTGTLANHTVPVPQQAAATLSERRAQAYAKMLKGQRYILELRQGGSSEELVGLARQTFQEAAALDPGLAEAHTLLAEIAFYYPPLDLELAGREGATATRIDPDNYGAHRILSRMYSLKSGIREGNLNRTFVDLAIQELKDVVRLDKNNAEGWALLGEFYYANERTGPALDAWNHWAEVPASTDTRFFQYLTNRELSTDAAHARLGEALLKAGRTTEALAAIRRAIALAPDNKDHADLLAQAIEAGGLDDKVAIAELERMVTADPVNASTAQLLARVQARSGRLDDGAATLRAAIARQPKGEFQRQALRTSLAQLYIDALRYTDAIAVYEEQLKEGGIGQAPVSSEAQKLVATRILQRMIDVQKRADRPTDAVATIERMRQLLGKDDPTPDAHYVLFLRDQGKRSEALEAVRAARQRYPQESDFVDLEAQVLADLGRVDEGVALLQKRLKGSSEDFAEYLSISGLYLQAARAPEAVKAALKALELVPAERPEMTASGLIALSAAQERAGDPKGSETSLRRILSHDPNNATALNNLGYFLTERNERLKEALEMIQRAVGANPRNASFLDSLGWVYFKLGQLKEAEQNLNKAARANATSATIQEHLGEVYHALSDSGKARAAWEKALSLSVEPAQAARLKARLNGQTK
ncbi:MAG: tetratricopeptide repeat protein [Pyrinomonadaceae bacterium]